MNKNYIPDVAKMLGVELGEKFKIKYADGNISKYYFHFNNEGLIKGNHYYADCHVSMLINGKCKIVKQPWLPQLTEHYWTFEYINNDSQARVVESVWVNSVSDKMRFRLGLIYKTRDKAIMNLERMEKFFSSDEPINWEEK